jgi:hypothetical protein
MSAAGHVGQQDGDETPGQTASAPAALVPVASILAAVTPAVAVEAFDSGESAEPALVRAQAAAQAKRVHEANGIRADVLIASPDHPAALALPGVIAATSGNLERGVALLRSAMQPDTPISVRSVI